MGPKSLIILIRFSNYFEQVASGQVGDVRSDRWSWSRQQVLERLGCIVIVEVIDFLLDEFPVVIADIVLDFQQQFPQLFGKEHLCLVSHGNTS
jgi:hypothetical protein